MRAPARPGWPSLLLAVLAIHLALVLPDRPEALRITLPLLRLPVELPLILLTLAALRSRLVAGLVAAALALLVALKLGDLAMLASLGRRFNPVGDLSLAGAGLRLLAGAVGTPAAVALAVAALLAVLGLAALLWRAAATWADLSSGPQRRVALALSAALAAGALLLPGPHATVARFALDRLRLSAATLADLRDFRRLAASDPMQGAPGALSRLDRDLLVIFVESYGRASLDGALYAKGTRELLAASEADLAASGLAMRSGWLAAPTSGGQSWLSHATFAMGLWIDSQSRYRAALASGRASLFGLAAANGLRTAAVMPAITRPWPESQAMGFQTLLGAADLGYRGKPFNWVTMPDQFTLQALDRLLRDGSRDDGPPLVAQVALISSHAPWVPVPRMLDWDRLGDGRVFDAMAEAGDPTQVVWRDPDRVRAQYGRAIDYSLRAVLGYARRHTDDPPLLIVLGDHQAAGSIAQDVRAEVPLHVIGPPDLVARTAEWGLSEGLIPPAEAPVLPMDRMRDLILRSLGDAPAERASR